MSSNSNKSTVGDPKESSNVSVAISNNTKAMETSVNPSGDTQEKETQPVSSNKKETSDKEKRQRTLSQKAIQNAIQTKAVELNTGEKALINASDTVYTVLKRRVSVKEIESASLSLEEAYTKYLRILKEVENLYKQDIWGEFTRDAQLTAESSQITLQYAHTAINNASERQRDIIKETKSLSSRQSCYTSSSHTSTSSNRARRRALTEAAAAREQADFDRIMAEKENERRQFEAEEELRREQIRAQHERDMAILAAEKATAIADVKLRAIEQSIVEENGLYVLREEDEAEDARSRTQTWINTQHQPQQKPTTIQKGGENTTLPIDRYIDRRNTPLAPPAVRNIIATEKRGNIGIGSLKPSTPKGFAGNQPIYISPTPISGVAITNRCEEGIAETNQQLVASLARQNLLKCHPDVFDGDATLFHPWKNSFKAMIQDTNLNPSQEIAYLRTYTKGKVQELVDNFRKRQQNNPILTLNELWAELQRRFGNTAVITNSLLETLRESAKFSGKDKAKLQKFADVCSDVDNQMTHLSGLACLNYPNAIRPIVDNLPNFLKFKWEKQIVSYAEENNDAYPGFHKFATMVQKQARLRNHPNVLAGESSNHDNASRKYERKWNPEATTRSEIERKRVLKTETRGEDGKDRDESDHKKEKYCSFHERKGHELNECKAFGEKSLEERTEWIKTAGLCFRCLIAKHRANQCGASVKCGKCNSNRHPTILHKEKEVKKDGNQGEETEELQSRCTSVCQGKTGGLSCSKIVLVDVFAQNKPEKARRVYAIMDDQSNASMISPNLVHQLDVDGPTEKYLLSTCSTTKETKYGRRISGLAVKSLNGRVAKLPKLVECDHIPQDKCEIPSPTMTEHYPHLQEITKEIPALDQDAKIEILIGRDAPELLKVRAFKNGPKGAPWAQKLILGWTVSGQMCLDRVGGPVHISARHTTVKTLHDKPALESECKKENCTTLETLSEFETIPCPNYFKVKEKYSERSAREEITKDIYHTTPEDNEASTSWEDRRFLEIMNKGIHENESGNWEMPLPFRSQNVVMPNNRKQALNRLHGLLRCLKKKPQMEQDYFEFLAKVFERGHAVPVPPDELSEKKQHDSRTTREQTEKVRPSRVWYLPHFGVYHPKKPDQIRVVFDSSCEDKGVSLNKELLAGPDLMNSLLGVLMRFRQENIGVICDVEQMFHSFHVDPKHRDFLRFLWFKNNDPSQEIVEYRMTVHLFGNGPSPAVATFGMRKTAEDGEERYGTNVKRFICRDFYVDDGLTSRSTDKEAIDLVKGAQATLATANLRLHKVASNSLTVMEAIPAEDRAKNIRDLDLRQDVLPTQRSLGVQWDLQKDTFTFSVSLPEKPFTRRGVLSVVNSVYDPLGLAAPVILVGKLLLQQLVILGKEKQNDNPLGWDDPLPDSLMRQWQCWRDELVDLKKVSVCRCYHPKSFSRVVRNEVHAFSDASKDAIGTAIYLRQVDQEGVVSVTLAFGQAKVAPIQPTSIPRLELCAAVLSTQAVKKLQKELELEIHDVIFYTDSKVILGYIKNEVRRFHVYVANRVQSIRDVSEPRQWKYIDTSKNPADQATRGTTAKALMESEWLNGPTFLKQAPLSPSSADDHGTGIDENDPEVQKRVNVCATNSKKVLELGSKRFDRFSNWSTLQRAIASLIVRAKQCKVKHDPRAPQNDRETSSKNQHLPTTAEIKQATTAILKAVQRESFAAEINVLEKRNNDKPESRYLLKERRKILRKSSLYRLDPFIDEEGIIRVGGRLHRSDLAFEEKHPVLLPKKHHLSELAIRHYHEKVYHQGRQITHGALRQAGYWVIGGHGMIAKILSSCVTCRKLRGGTLTQHMANLPTDRMEICPPFTNVGLDVFGPWTVRTRKLRGGAVNTKRWGLVFTCLSSRAIHIEVLQSMDASAFICALRRFFAIRGPAARLRCDCGTNFVGGKSELSDALMEMDQKQVERYATEQGCEWIFNPPHASHFGGAWERQIGTIRRILNAMLLSIGSSQLDHELLVTLMAEVTGIVNSRPITAITSDIDEPNPLTPAMLLTMKKRPLAPPPGKFVAQDLYAHRRWRRAQYLADQFWLRWRREYLQNLQIRSKWCEKHRNLTVGDGVMVKDKDVSRNDWPMGRVTESMESEDGKVRKAKVTVCKEGKTKTVFRPISEFILLLPTKPELKDKDEISLGEECKVRWLNANPISHPEPVLD